MYDKSLLPEAGFEFVVISDMHYMRPPGAAAAEFENRRKESLRRVLHLASALRPSFVVHNGDMTQDCPDNGERFRETMGEAVELMRQGGISPHYVAGNQDLGDKPDPTSPGTPVTSQVLEWYHHEFGPSWYSFDHADCHFMVLNSQIMNTDLPEARQQQAWAEGDLAAHRGKRHFIFLHLPPYLFQPDEASLGHYNNLAEPARGWLLHLIREHRAESIFAGHVHFAFFDRLGDTRLFMLGSPAFTRPGFSYLFSGPLPPQQGWDDRAKLGFYLVRVRPDKADVHFIRTEDGEDPSAVAAPGEARLLTALSGALPDSPLGVTLEGRLATFAEIPLAWPSAAKETVRNDYPLLACLEMGVRHVRVALEDFEDPLQRRRLEILRGEGIALLGYALVSGKTDLAALSERYRGQLDGIELQIVGCGLPDWDRTLGLIDRAVSGTPVTLLPVMARELPAKHLTRPRYGGKIHEVESINQLLSRRGIKVARLICQLEKGRPVKEQIDDVARLLPLSHIGGIDLALDFNSSDEAANAARAAEAFFWTAASRRHRVYFEPLIDINRTMDLGHGLLDHLCNPRPAAKVLQSLNGILAGRLEESIDLSIASFSRIPGGSVSNYTAGGTTYSLVCATGAVGQAVGLAGKPQGRLPGQRPGLQCQPWTTEAGDPDAQIYSLTKVTVRRVAAPDISNGLTEVLAQGPALVVQRSQRGA